jgi:glycerophosphoryl diester phosphodiesterase
VITDITQTVAITTAYGTGLLNWYTFDHSIYGFILTTATDLFWGQGLINAMHAKGLKVLVCGPECNNVERLKESMNFGVDFIMTDEPNVFYSLLNSPAK